jgi:hypothetical protein
MLRLAGYPRKAAPAEDPGCGISSQLRSVGFSGVAHASSRIQGIEQDVELVAVAQVR